MLVVRSAPAAAGRHSVRGLQQRFARRRWRLGKELRNAPQRLGIADAGAPVGVLLLQHRSDVLHGLHLAGEHLLPAEVAFESRDGKDGRVEAAHVSTGVAHRGDGALAVLIEAEVVVLLIPALVQVGPAPVQARYFFRRSKAHRSSHR